ncbi:O-antigen translocase [Carboxylicivirga sp. RSCT41]|uniref:O-antigen translocase n=1 Tax=Carboxylicivirga agarovorans TaxID=3417570 RepID=UPI003D34482A
MALLKNRFLSVSFKNSFQIIFRFLVGLINMKVVAIYTGPTGMALFGQLQNALQLGTTISNLGFTNGIIKYTSQNNLSPNERQSIISTSITLTLIASLVLGSIVMIMSEEISVHLFKTKEYNFICQLIGIHLISSSMLNLILSIYNGLMRLKRFIIINLINSFFLLLLVSLGTIFFNVKGMLWALIFQSLFSLIFAFFLLSKDRINFKLAISKAACLKLGNYSLMTLVSGIVGPLVLIIIRDILIHNETLHNAGIWESINKISNSYIVLLTSAFNFYLLPKFSSLKSSSSIRKEVISTLKILIPVLLLGAASMYFLRKPIISTLFSQEFSEAGQIIRWQIIGDFFKVISWVFAYLLISKTKTIAFVISEVASGILQVSFSKIMILKYGLEGSTMAYGLENAIYFIILLLFFFYYWGFKKE